MKDLLAVLRNPNLRLLLTGRFISSVGDWLYQVALSVAIFQYSGGGSRGSFYVGILWVIRLIPALTLAPLGGSLAGKLGYRRAMIIADVARLLVVAILAIVLRSSLWPVIYPMAFLVTAFGRLFFPASVGLIPSLVESKEQRLAANASTMQAESLAAILGSACGGIVAGLGYINVMLGIDAGTFALSALFLWLIRPRAAAAAPAKPPAGKEPEEAMEKGFLGTLRFLRRRPLLVFAASVMALPELASGALYVWIVPYSAQSLHLGNAGVGYLYSALGVGYLIGGFIAAAAGSSIRLDRLLAISVAIGGVAFAVFGLWALAAVAVVCVLLIGLAETVEFAAYETLLQQAVPEDLIGRASGAMDSLLFNMVFIGTAISGAAAALLGLQVAITATGVLVVLATGIAWWYLQGRTAGQIDAEALGRVPAFAGVAPEIREWAVRRMVREDVPRGTAVIRAGEAGDRFYTIACGKVRVEANDNGVASTRELGPGECFGEIALLHDIPRTATVTALQPLVLWAMSREDFQELQGRAAEFKDSLWEIASARLQGPENRSLAPASRG